MCIVISGETQPDTTKLMNIPVKMVGELDKYNFFIYVNNFDLHSKNNNNFNDFNSFNSFNSFNNSKNMQFESLLGNNNFSGNYASFQSSYNSPFQSPNNNHNSSIMVVPFPVEKGTDITKIGLVDVSTDKMKELRRNIKNLKPKEIPRHMTLSSGSNSFSRNSTPLKVHKIGNYNISVALSKEQLLNRIDWSKFTKPYDFDKRVNTFNNTQLYPSNYDWFYVVAEAEENIEDDGFGVVYPQLNNYQYIPTAHEDTEYRPQFDVEIYSFNYNKENNRHINYNGYNDINFNAVLNNINEQRVKMLDETYKKMLFDENITSFNFIEETKQMKNHNVWLSK